MKYRKLRIAWSVAWGIAAVLLVVLWVRSYLVYDSFVGRYPNGLFFFVYSAKGVYTFSTYPLLGASVNDNWWFLVRRAPNDMAIGGPFSFTIVVACAVSIAPWIRYRFSLRTLLIATTLVAVVLGIIVAFS